MSSEFEHLLASTLAVRRKGLQEWRDLSRRERAFMALVLNEHAWLKEDGLTIGGALDLIQPHWASLVTAVESAIDK